MEDSQLTQPMEKSEKYDKHKIEDCCSTLMKAEEIKEDAELYELCKAHMGKKTGHINSAMGKKPESLDELKSIAKKKAKEESETV